MISKTLSTNPFLFWATINLLTGLWEIYVYLNRNQLTLEPITIWEKISRGEITLSNFWIEAWSEYSKVDSRYITAHYVWGFELFNTVLAFAFILALVVNSSSLVKITLQIAIINCLAYFISLGYSRYNTNQQINKYARKWQYPVYYFISGIWLIVPFWLLLQLE